MGCEISDVERKVVLRRDHELCAFISLWRKTGRNEKGTALTGDLFFAGQTLRHEKCSVPEETDRNTTLEEN